MTSVELPSRRGDAAPPRRAALVALTTGSAWRSALAVGVGLVAASAGAGVALPHLAAGGPLVAVAAGTVALVAGLVLLLAGAIGLVRRTPRLARLPVALALLVTAYVGLVSGFVGVAATTVPRGHVGSSVPADAGLPYRDVTFATPDGVSLSGWYIPSRNGAAVVLAHGSGETRSAVLDHAVVLARHGYGVLLFDARGHGRSAGRGMDLGWYGDEDMIGATSFALAQPDVRGRVALVGLSLGGENALGAAAADPRVRAVVAEGVTGRTAADHGWLSEHYGVRGLVQERIDAVTYGIADLLTAAGPPTPLRTAAAAVAPRPVLLIAAGDVPEESYAGQDIRAAAPGNVQLWVVPGSGHTGALASHPAEWEQRVTAVLAAALLPA